MACKYTLKIIVLERFLHLTPKKELDNYLLSNYTDLKVWSTIPLDLVKTT